MSPPQLSEDQRTTAPTRLRPWAAGLVLLTALLAFWPSLDNGFTFDDHAVLVENSAVREPASVGRVLTDPTAHTSSELARAYRPLRTLLFQAQYQVFGLEPAGYHGVSLGLHALNALLVLILLARFARPALAVGSALLFAAHPLQSEVVASIKAQDDLLASALTLAGTLGFVHWSRGRRAPAGGCALMALFGLALMAKESAVMLPALWLAAYAADCKEGRLLERTRSAPRVLLAGMVAFSVAFLIWRAGLLHEAAAVAPGTWLFPSSVAQIPRVLLLFVNPSSLTIDYSALPVLGLDAWQVWASVIVQGVVLALVIRARSRVLGFAWAWFYLCLFPSLNPLDAYFVFAERFAYLALAGLSILIVACVARVLQVRLAVAPSEAWLLGLCILSTLGLIFVARSRTNDWRDDETLFRAALQHDPESAVMRSALVSALLSSGQTEAALEILPEASTSVPVPRSFTERTPLAQRGLAALQTGDWESAATFFEAITSTELARWHDWLNLGTAYVNQGRDDAGERAFARVLELQPDNAPARRMLCRVHLEREEYLEAARVAREACDLEPEHETGWYFLVFCEWKASGEGPALAALARACARGANLGALLAQDRARWAGASSKLLGTLRDCDR